MQYHIAFEIDSVVTENKGISEIWLYRYQRVTLQLLFIIYKNFSNTIHIKFSFAIIILDLYTEKNIDRFHEMPSKANYTLHNNGAVTISRNVIVSERSKSDAPNGKKIFVCSGFYQSFWVPLKKESMKIEEWRIQSQNVYILTDYSHGGNKDD